MKSEKKFIIRIIILFVVGLMFVAYGKYVTAKVRNEVIKSAELIEITDEGYTIGFGDEVHEYDFEE